MKFAVCYKGIRKFSGSLDCAIRYLVEQWGSAAQAYEIGVRLQQVPMKR
jgi:hypothetical protein